MISFFPISELLFTPARKIIMKYISVTETAKKWGLTDRAVRLQCAEGLIPGAFLTGRTWNIPEDALPPERKNAKRFSDNNLLNILKFEKDGKIKGGIYRKNAAVCLNAARIQSFIQRIIRLSIFP